MLCFTASEATPVAHDIEMNKSRRIPYSTAGFYTGKKPQKNEATLSDSLNDIDINKECDDTSTEQNTNSKEDREKEREQDTALTNDSLEEQLEEEEERGEGDGRERERMMMIVGLLLIIISQCVMVLVD
uniref:Uncharacterized protein n=1 Tax=Amphimedon queenslandica TaxID=400682 RepID=A0A1X7U5D3_AMPQE